MRHARLPGIVSRCPAEVLPPLGLLLLFLLLLTLILLQPGCGGGSSAAPAQPPPPPPPGDFAISVSPGSVTLAQGATSQPIAVSIAGTNGFTGSAQVSLAGLPAGVSVNPSGSFSIDTGASRSVIVGVSAATATGTFSLSVQGVSGSLSHQAPLSLTVQAGVQLFPPSRSGFVRIDSALAASDALAPARRRIVYDPAHRRIFVANSLMNRVDVLSADQELVGSIPVAEPSSVDISRDGTKIWVGSSLEQITSIDAADLQAATISGGGIATPLARFGVPQEIVPLSNGMMLVNLGQAGTQNAKLARWDPSTNAFTDVTVAGLEPGPGAMARSADHSKVVVAANNSTGAIFLYEAQTNSFTRNTQFAGATPALLASNRDGSRFAVYLATGSGGQVGLLDGSLTGVSFRTVTAVWGLVFSTDGRYLYISENVTEPAAITILDAANGQFIGRIPDVQPSGIRSQIQDADETLQIFGISNRGISFLDAAVPRQFGPPYSSFAQTAVVTPGQGSPTGGTATSVAGANFVTGTRIFFGGQAASNVSVTNATQILATTPPVSKGGPVNLSAFSLDGWMAFAPEAFSYGPQVLRLLTTAGSANGGNTIEVVGYGFGAAASQLSVSIGGQAAIVKNVADTPATLRAIGLPPDYPFPIQMLTIQTPPGTPGAADLQIASQAGTTVAPGAFHYLKDAQIFPHGGLYKFLLYDQRRQRIYLSNIDHVDVFDLNAGKFLDTPLNPPGGAAPCPGGPPPNAGLRGLALTPDGSQLVVADFGAQMVYLLNPDAPGTGSCVAVGGVPGFLNSGPARVAATSVGNVFVAMAAETAGGCSQCLGVLDPVTKTIQLPSQPEVSKLTGTPIVQAANGGRNVFLVFGGTPGGPVAVWEAATNRFQNEPGNTSSSDLAVADDGNMFVTGRNQASGLPEPRIWAQDLHLATRGLYRELERWPGMTGVPGETMHASGGLVYQPFVAAQPGETEKRGGVDIFDARSGMVRQRVFFSEMLRNEQDALRGSFLTVDEAGRRMFALTESGLSILELANAPISIGSVQPRTVPTAGGTIVTIRGSGFQPGASGTKISVNGSQITATFVDANTLRFTTPAMTAGWKRITVTNPDAETAAFDAAFSVN